MCDIFGYPYENVFHCCSLYPTLCICLSILNSMCNAIYNTGMRILKGIDKCCDYCQRSTVMYTSSPPRIVTTSHRLCCKPHTHILYMQLPVNICYLEAEHSKHTHIYIHRQLLHEAFHVLASMVG